MSASIHPFPAWVGVPSLDLLVAADQDEATAVRVMAHPTPTTEDCELALYLLDRADNQRAEIARRLEGIR